MKKDITASEGCRGGVGVSERACVWYAIAEIRIEDRRSRTRADGISLRQLAKKATGAINGTKGK